MSPLPPSRRDTIGPSPRDVSNLAAQVRHHGSYLHSLDPGIQEGRFGTPKTVPPGPPRQLVGGDGPGDDTDYAWEYDDRHTVAVRGTQTARLSHIPIDESLQVFWRPGGHGELRLASEYFTVDDQIVTIPDPGSLWAIGDTFSFQYQYEVEDQVVDFEFVAFVTGTYHYPENTVTFVQPPTIQVGDFLVIANRGSVAPGGGDVTLGFSTTDPRISRLYSATLPVSEAVFTGFATSSTADIVTDVIPNPSYLPGAVGIMAIFRGINGVASATADESAGATPEVAGIAAIAVTWDGNGSFSLTHADPPTGYTDAGSSGLAYAATDISYWSDPAAESSVPGTFTGEGCLVIALA